MEQLTFSSLELAVKAEQQMPEANTINIYVYLGLERAKSFGSVEQTKRAHLRVVNTLLETMCDDCLSLRWRTACHKWIKKLMPLLFELLHKDDYWQRVADVKLLHTYFLKDKKELHPLTTQNTITRDEQSPKREG